MYPAYVRGQAYLKARQGQQAAAEFQKFLDHRGITIISLWARWLTLASPVPTPSLAIPPTPEPPIRISSDSGKTPTPTSPS